MEESTIKTFEQIFAESADMTEEEMKQMIEDVKAMCKNFCGECPSYTGTEETELAFCALGRSDIIEDEQGCMCGGCPITSKMALRWDYYCMKGSGKEQSEKE